MNNDVQTMFFCWVEDFFLESKKKFRMILFILILVDAGADDIDIPVAGGYVYGFWVPAIICLTPVSANKVNATEDNFIIVLIDDISTLSVEWGDGWVNTIFLSEIIHK